MLYFCYYFNFFFSPSTFSGTHVRTVRIGSYAHYITFKQYNVSKTKF